MRARRFTWIGAPLVAALCAVALAACGSSGSSSSSSSASASGGGGASANVAAANQVLAPYTGHPSTFPVDQPLKKKLPAGSTVAYLQCVTPICALLGQLLAPAVKTMGDGLKLSVTKAGASAQSLQSAMQTIISQKPAALFIPAVEPDSINTQLHQVASMKIPIASDGVMNQQKYGIGAAMFNASTAQVSGKVLAAWVVKTKGSKANVAFYLTPELSFGAYILQGFKQELTALCPSCKVRTVVLPVATIGNSAPSRVVSDLQSNPDTNVGVFSTEEAADGLAAAMKTAGLTTTITGFGPDPEVLQDIKRGAISSGLGLAFPVMVWAQLDEAVRLGTNQPLTAGEKAGIPPLQMLTKPDITFNPTLGYPGYTDFAARFTKLWNAG